MRTPEQQTEAAQTRLYWDHHAPLTLVVLVVCVLLSALARPVSWQLAFGGLVGGSVVYVAEVLADKGFAWVAAVTFLVGFGVGVWGMVVGDAVSGPLMWVQGIGVLGAGFMAARVVGTAIKAAPGADGVR